uniref:Uncharacterized protein n=1 Tax=Myoviridae sp. cty4e12 TaxID=2827718 RepID=A0A8S5SPL0_9CAUD|nr:MAG TPA: hypothetical protein [Myoviridae sp. cty4e12]
MVFCFSVLGFTVSLREIVFVYPLTHTIIILCQE